MCLGSPRNYHQKIHLEILHIPASAVSQSDFVVQFHGLVSPFHPNVAIKAVLGLGQFVYGFALILVIIGSGSFRCFCFNLEIRGL